MLLIEHFQKTFHGFGTHLTCEKAVDISVTSTNFSFVITVISNIPTPNNHKQVCFYSG